MQRAPNQLRAHTVCSFLTCDRYYVSHNIRHKPTDKARMFFGTRIVSLSAATLIPIAAWAQAAPPDAIYYELPGMANVSVTSNVTYRMVNENGREVALTMDVYRPPTARSGQRFPAL